MKKQYLAGLGAALACLGCAGFASAGLTTIGTALYQGAEYNLIWDDDNNGKSVVWLDYSKNSADWSSQQAWAADLDGQLTYKTDPAYSVSWVDDAWRLPSAVDGTGTYGYEGDPDGDGIYSYVTGWNLANSELGHLYYDELGNVAAYSTDSTKSNRILTNEEGLVHTGDFDFLVEGDYWTGTIHEDDPNQAWRFDMEDGSTWYSSELNSEYLSLAIRTAEVTMATATSPVPEPGSVLLFGVGIAGLAGVRRRQKTASM